MSRPKERRILAGLVVAFAALIFVALMLLGSATEQTKAAARVAHTRDVLEKMNELVAYLTEAETGRRGYVLSGQDVYLRLHTGRVAYVHTALQELRALTKDNLRYSAAYDQLGTLILQRLTIFTNSIKARQEHGLDVPAQVTLMEQSHQAMYPIRQIVSQMTTDETALLKARQEIQKEKAQGTAGFAVLVSLFALGLFATLFFLFARANRHRRRAEEVPEQTNLELEQRVKQRTAELSSERTLLRTLIDALPDMVFTKDTAGRFSMCNAAELQHVGLASEQELVGKSVFDFYSRELAEIYHTDDLQALSGQPVLNREEPSLDAAGHRRWYLTTKVPLRDHAGKIAGMVGISRDITDRKQAEEALRESQERFRTLAESLPHLVWTCRPDGWCDYLSRQWVEYTGRPAEEQLGYGWAEQLHPEDRERVQAEWAKATERGDYFDIEFRIRRADGVYRWFKTRALPLHDSSGRIVKWFGSNTDFEDYKRSEQRLQTQLERLNLLDQTTRAIGERQDLQSIFQVVIRSLEDNLPIDFGCVCLYEAGQESLTVTCVGSKSQPLALDLAMPEQARIKIDQNGLSRCVRGQLVHEPDIREVNFPFPQRLVHGGLHSLVVAPLLVESKVFGVLVAARREVRGFSSGECEFLRQLSGHVALAAHQVQLCGALQQAYDDLRQTQQAVMQQERLRALGQMASGIAHDINNAISPVALYTESLLERESNLSPRAREYLTTIQHAIEDVTQTVARMREFYRQREPQLSLAPVDFNRVIQQVLDLTRARWNDMPQEHGLVIRLQTELAPDLPTIMGAESEIRDALTNLILNAVDAMPEGGVFTLRTRAVHGPADGGQRGAVTYVAVEVSDTGVGMDEETKRRCLEPFFTTKGERGTGLGLAMVYGMVERHSAELEIQSAPGKGTTMRLIFPILTTVEASSTRTVTPARPTQRLRILIVDDDPLLIKSLRDTLESDGHLVVVADSGQAGISAFEAARQRGEPFALVFTDLGMPYVDGRKVAASIKAASPVTPVVLLTGWGQRLVAEGEIPPHVDRVLNKPPKLRELRATLAELVSTCEPSRQP